jgi:hypothetical protein
MLILVQVIAEGGWLSVVAAAIQVVVGQLPQVGPFELAVAAAVGLGWVRRRFWRGRLINAIGLPVLALFGGALVWLLDPAVPPMLADGDVLGALRTNPAGWIGIAAVLRGAAHRAPDLDEDMQDALLRWGLAIVAASWLVGSLAAQADRAAPGAELAFKSAALIGTLAFAAGGLVAAAFARIAEHQTDRSGRPASWTVVTVGLTAAVISIGLIVGALFGVPLEALALALIGPIRLILAAMVVLVAPLAVLGGWLAEWLHAIIPNGITLPRFALPIFGIGPTHATNPAPTIIFFTIVGILVLLELAAVLVYLHWRVQTTTMTAEEVIQAGEERTIVRPPPVGPAQAPTRGRRLDPSDPIDAYLLALRELDARPLLERLPAETPAVHAARLSTEPVHRSLAHLAAAYQLARYGLRSLGARERQRSARRLASFREALRRPASQ